jgi:hypothetical protein
MKKSSLGTNLAPSKTTPITGALNMKIVQMINEYLVYGLQGVKVPNVNLWPGDLETKTNLLSNVKLSISAQLKNELISTGYYVPPGVDLYVEVQSMTSMDNWYVQIRIDENSLWTSNHYYRYPVSSVKRVLNAQTKIRISSTFGGLLYFQASKSGSLKVLASNVVKSPYYNFADQGSISSFNNQLLSLSGVW